MKVHIILEHQLDVNECVVDTKVMSVFLNKEDAEAELECLEAADKRYVEALHCDPCKYEIVPMEVIE